MLTEWMGLAGESCPLEALGILKVVPRVANRSALVGSASKQLRLGRK